MSNELRWHFGFGGAEAHGPKDSITRTFTGNKYYSLAREVIQNSLDAVLDESRAVRISFSLFEIARESLSGIFELDETISRCRANYSDVKDFAAFCDKAIGLLSEDRLKCLRISDFNTKGLVYGEGKTPFYAFMEAVGYTLKESATSGGSFGFGKGAYYAASGLRTLLVSSIYGEGEFVFQGKARLTTHFDDEGNKKDYTGLLGLGNQAPITDPDVIPTDLVRTEMGTDVILVGFDDDDATWKDELIKSVLNNFWLAIWKNELVVEIGDITIDQSNLEVTIERYYSETDDDGKANEPEGWNPYPYFKSVRYIADGPNNFFFEENLPTLGHCTMSVFRKEGLPNRTMFVRGPKMTVFKRTSNKASNYVGVFECDDDSGNEILRAMENPEHNQWRKNNYLEDGKPHPDGVKAELEFSGFVNRCLEKLQIQDAGAKQKIMGLERYLTIPEDLLPDEEGGGGLATSGFDSTSEESDTETGLETVKKSDEPSKIRIKVKNDTTVIQDDTGSPTEGIDDIFTGTPGGEGEGGGGEPGPSPGDHPTQGGEDDDQPIRRPLRVRARVIAQSLPNGKILHLLRVFCEKQATAEIEVFSGVDNDGIDDDSLIILNATQDGVPVTTSGNKLRNISLDVGANNLLVEFDSDHKHSLRIKSYELC